MKRLLPVLIVLGVLAVFFGPRFLHVAKAPDGANRFTDLAGAADVFASGNRLVVEKGSAAVTRADGKQETVTAEAQVGVGDRIIVSADGFAELRWFDDSISRLAGGTEMRITTADFNPDDVSETHVDFSVIKGAVWSKVVNLVDEDSSFEAENGDVVAGVRGSAFNFQVEDDGSVLVDSMEHAVAVREGSKETFVVSGQSVVLSHGAMRMARTDGKKIAAEEWYVKNLARDKETREKLKQEGLERLRLRVGSLPDEAGWMQKQRAIETAINRTADTGIKARMEASVSAMRAAEFVVGLREKGGDAAHMDEILSGVDASLENLRASDLDDREKERAAKAIRAELKLLDRSLSDILPDNEAMYDAKEKLRAKAVALAETDQERERLTDLHTRRALFELHDSLLNGWTLACERKEQVADFRAYAKTHEEFDAMLRHFLEDVQSRCGGKAGVLQTTTVRHAPLNPVLAPVPDGAAVLNTTVSGFTVTTGGVTKTYDNTGMEENLLPPKTDTDPKALR